VIELALLLADAPLNVDMEQLASSDEQTFSELPPGLCLVVPFIAK